MTNAVDAGTGSYSKILLAVTPETDPAMLAHAVGLAQHHRAELVAFSCVEAPTDRAVLARALGLQTDQLINHLVQDRRRLLDKMIVEAAVNAPVTVEVRTGKAFIETIRYVLSEGVDLVIKSAEVLTGAQRFLFASTDHHLVRKCPCPVWLQLPNAPAAPRTILAAVDVDEWDASEPDTLHDLNLRVIETAANLAAREDATVQVLHAWDAAGEGMIWAFASAADARLAAETYINGVFDSRQRALERLLKQFADNNSAKVLPKISTRLVRGPVDTIIADHVSEFRPDLLVLGTVARTGLSGVIIGNTAEDILNRVDCSVVAVKPRSFRCPLQA